MKVFYLILYNLLFVNCCLACQGNGTNSGSGSGGSKSEKDWWQTAQFYQIYPRSFKDSNNDGIGDIQGIISKLHYLKEIGVTATWLSPIFKSPMADFGYDISDFFDIQPEYGTLKDFDQLIEKAKELGIKIILDFVPNHSSDENEWFKKSVRRERGYEDFYVWHDGYIDEFGRRQPPSNWLQAFRGSAWEWNEERQQYYLHQFAKQQPDLNYRNPAVVAQMQRVLKFWLDRGVAGFRVDAVPCVFEVKPDENGRYPDEPKSGFTEDPDDSSYLLHIYTQDQPETLELVYQWRQLFDDYQRIHGGETRILMIETYSPLDYLMKMYGNRTTKGAEIPFNFQFIIGGNDNKNNTNLKAGEYVKIINKWLKKMPAGRTANWVMGNHDQRRVGSRYGENHIDLMNTLQMILPGVSVTYMGEELGMLDLDISWEDTRDPAACNSNPNIYEQFTRDPARTPFQWDHTRNAGFSTNASTWLPINPNYITVNVEYERNSPQSHLNIYKALSKLRQTKTLQNGDLAFGNLGDNILAVKRSLKNEKTYILVANLFDHKITIDLSQIFYVTGSYKTKIVNSFSKRPIGASINIHNLAFEPFEIIILESM